MKYKLALIGFGNVAQGLAEILSSKASLLREKFDADISIVAICDLYFGSIADPDGLDPQSLLIIYTTRVTSKNTPRQIGAGMPRRRLGAAVPMCWWSFPLPISKQVNRR